MLCVFFFNDTATTEIYTLSLHDALPIYQDADRERERHQREHVQREAQRPHEEEGRDHGDRERERGDRDRKSTRLNSSHANISYAVFCLKKKKKQYSHSLSFQLQHLLHIL